MELGERWREIKLHCELSFFFVCPPLFFPSTASFLFLSLNFFSFFFHSCAFHLVSLSLLPPSLHFIQDRYLSLSTLFFFCLNTSISVYVDRYRCREREREMLSCNGTGSSRLSLPLFIPLHFETEQSLYAALPTSSLHFSVRWCCWLFLA